MRRIGTLLVFVLAGGLLGTLAPTASAGGWDSLEPRRDHYLPGQTAVLRGAFAVNRLKETGRIEDGPYYAYLTTPTCSPAAVGLARSTHPRSRTAPSAWESFGSAPSRRGTAPTGTRRGP